MIEAKLLWRAYRKSPTLFRTLPSPTPYGLPFLEIGVLQLSYPLLSQEQVKLRTSNLAVHLQGQFEEKPIKILEKRERGRIQGLPNFLGIRYYLRNRTGKATDFKFYRNIHRVDWNKSP